MTVRTVRTDPSDPRFQLIEIDGKQVDRVEAPKPGVAVKQQTEEPESVVSAPNPFVAGLLGGASVLAIAEVVRWLV